jgi:DNA-directed RNA polymerase specialized sigma subunit
MNVWDDENCPHFAHYSLNVIRGSMVSFLYKDSKSSLIREVYNHDKTNKGTK